MGFVPGIDQYKVNVDLSAFAQGLSWGFWVLDNAPGSAGRNDTLVSVVDTWMVGTMIPDMSQDYAYTGLAAYDMSSLTAPVKALQKSPLVFGGLTGAGAPANTAVVVSLYTEGRGRSARGRIYLPGALEASLNGQTWVSAVSTDYEADIQALQTALNGADFELIVSSSQTGGVDRTERLAQPVTEVIGKAKIGTQRRRIRYGDGSA